APDRWPGTSSSRLLSANLHDGPDGKIAGRLFDVKANLALDRISGRAYAAGVVRWWVLAVAGPLFLLSPAAHTAAQTPLPILRGIVVMPTGESRAYLEDAQTGSLAGYASRDLVGDSRIEEIRDDRVLLRRGDDVI